MGYTIGLLLIALPIWIVVKLGQRLYRHLAFDRIVAKNTQNKDSKPVQAMVAALEQNEQAEFVTLANDASMQHLRELNNRGDVADHPGRVAVFPSYAKNHPQDARAQYLNGCYLVNKAWDARGSGYYDTVSESDAAKFHQHLDEAKDALQIAMKLDPDMPDAYAEMLVILKGGGSRYEARELFDKAHIRFPNNIELHQNMLMLLTDRWGGSDAETIEFARVHGTQESAPDLACLIPFAHLQIWFGSDSDVGIGTYLSDKQIQREITIAFELFMKASAKVEQVQGRLDGLQHFACAFAMMDDAKNAKKAFKKMKGRYSSAAWNMWSNPEEMFTKSKLWAT